MWLLRISETILSPDSVLVLIHLIPSFSQIVLVCPRAKISISRISCFRLLLFWKLKIISFREKERGCSFALWVHWALFYSERRSLALITLGKNVKIFSIFTLAPRFMTQINYSYWNHCMKDSWQILSIFYKTKAAKGKTCRSKGTCRKTVYFL